MSKQLTTLFSLESMGFADGQTITYKNNALSDDVQLKNKKVLVQASVEYSLVATESLIMYHLDPSLGFTGDLANISQIITP